MWQFSLEQKIMGWNEVMYKITTSSLIWLIPAFIGVLRKRRKLGCHLHKKEDISTTTKILPPFKLIY